MNFYDSVRVCVFFRTIVVLNSIILCFVGSCFFVVVVVVVLSA